MENWCLDNLLEGLPGLVTLAWCGFGFVVMVADKILKTELKEVLAVVAHGFSDL